MFDLVASKHVASSENFSLFVGTREVSICGGGKRRRRMRFATRPVGSTPPYDFNRVRTLVARTVSPQLSWLWLLLQHPPILAYIYTQSSSIPRIVETRLELMVEISGCSRKCVTDSIRHTRDPNSTRVLDRKIRRSSSFERNFLLDLKLFRSLVAGTLRRARNEGRCLRCRTVRVTFFFSEDGQRERERERCWLGFNLCAAQPRALLVVAG